MCRACGIQYFSSGRRAMHFSNFGTLSIYKLTQTVSNKIKANGQNGLRKRASVCAREIEIWVFWRELAETYAHQWITSLCFAINQPFIN